MPSRFSTYLDAVRFLSAIMVLFAHLSSPQFNDGAVLHNQYALGQVGVAIFFVLSGYVISYVANCRDHSIEEFAISRLARMYSVVVPALAVTIAIDWYLHLAKASLPIPMYEYLGFWKYLPIFLTFTSEIGQLHVPVLTNAAFWSLSYEVWYYVAYAVFFYMRGRTRALLLAVLVPVLGLRVLLYAPVWLLGCLCYWAHQRVALPRTIARIGAAATALTAFSIWVSGDFRAMDVWCNSVLGGWPYATLHYSSHFSVHYLAGFLVALNFFCIRYCDLNLLGKLWLRRAIAYCASFSFALYLAHQPLIDVWAFVLRHDPHSSASLAILLAATLGCAWLFGYVSEHRKAAWRRLIGNLFQHANFSGTWVRQNPFRAMR